MVHRYDHPVGCYRTAWNTWFVQVRHQGELFYLGTFDTAEEAEERRDQFLNAKSGQSED